MWPELNVIYPIPAHAFPATDVVRQLGAVSLRFSNTNLLHRNCRSTLSFTLWHIQQFDAARDIWHNYRGARNSARIAHSQARSTTPHRTALHRRALIAPGAQHVLQPIFRLRRQPVRSRRAHDWWLWTVQPVWLHGRGIRRISKPISRPGRPGLRSAASNGKLMHIFHTPGRASAHT